MLFSNAKKRDTGVMGGRIGEAIGGRAGSRQYVVCRMDRLLYALPSDQVSEVAQAVAIRPLPKAGALVEGVFSCRGRLVPLLDIRRRFGLDPRPLHPAQHFIIADLGDRHAAIRVDGVERLAEIHEEDIEDTRQAVPDAEYIAGVAQLRDGLLLVHDLSTFLSACEAADLVAKLAAAEASGAPDP